MKNFADRLKYAMIQADMSQTILARKSGYPKSAISQYLSGKHIPGVDKVEALAAVLGVRSAFLMGLEVPSVELPSIPTTRIGTKTAARCMGKSEKFIRIGLQRGLLPFGSAVPGEGAKWNYYINPAKFRDYVGSERFNEFFHVSA